MPHPLLIFSQSGNLIQIVVINLHTWWQTVQIQISWLLKKPTDLDLHCLQNRIYPGSAGQGLSVFTIYEHGGHLDYWIMTICTNFQSPFNRRVHIQFKENWPRGFRSRSKVWKMDGWWQMASDHNSSSWALFRWAKGSSWAFGSGELKK